MIVIRATQRLLKQSRVKPAEDIPEPTAVLGEWYANLLSLPFPGRFVVLFVHNPSRLAVVAPGRSLRTTYGIFRERTTAILHRLGIDPSLVEMEGSEMEEYSVGRTQDRRLLGSMNDIARLLYWQAEDLSSYEQFDLQKVEDSFSGMPHVTARIIPDKYVRQLFEKKGS